MSCLIAHFCLFVFMVTDHIPFGTPEPVRTRTIKQSIKTSVANCFPLLTRMAKNLLCQMKLTRHVNQGVPHLFFSFCMLCCFILFLVHLCLFRLQAFGSGSLCFYSTYHNGAMIFYIIILSDHATNPLRAKGEDHTTAKHCKFKSDILIALHTCASHNPYT